MNKKRKNFIDFPALWQPVKISAGHFGLTRVFYTRNEKNRFKSLIWKS